MPMRFGQSDEDGTIPHCVRLADIAVIAGVSVSTVSRALSNPDRVNVQTAERIQRIAMDMGFPRKPKSPSRIGMDDGRSMKLLDQNIITFLVQDTSNGVSSQILRGAQETALASGNMVSVIETGDSLQRTETLLRRLVGRTRGVIIATDQINTGTIRWASRQFPLVILNRPVEGVNSIVPDATIGVTRALILLSHYHLHSIVYISSRVGAWSSRSRWDSLNTISTMMGLSSHRIGPVQPTIEGGMQAALSLEDHLPDAIITYNDLIAGGVILGLQSRGIQVPKDVSVIGFDNTLIAPVISPAITTIRIPRVSIGQAAVRTLLGQEQELHMTPRDAKLLEKLQQRGIPPITENKQAVPIPTSLIVRSSVGEPG